VFYTSDSILAFEALSGRRLACRNEEAYLSFHSPAASLKMKCSVLSEAGRIAVLRKCHR
jgi:hypothetical protein